MRDRPEDKLQDKPEKEPEYAREEKPTLHAILDAEPWPQIVCRHGELEEAIRERKNEGGFATPGGQHAAAPGDSAVNCPECLRRTGMMRKTNTGWSEIEMPDTARMDSADLHSWSRKAAALLDGMETRCRELGLPEAEELARASAALRGR